MYIVPLTMYYVPRSVINDQQSTLINGDQSIKIKKRGPEGPQFEL